MALINLRCDPIQSHKKILKKDRRVYRRVSRTLSIGDYVKALHSERGVYRKGAIGIVKGISDNSLCVEWKSTGGHDGKIDWCPEGGKEDHCWFIEKCEVRKICR